MVTNFVISAFKNTTFEWDIQGIFESALQTK